jgi:hypothetical protein
MVFHTSTSGGGHDMIQNKMEVHQHSAEPWRVSLIGHLFFFSGVFT